MAPPVTRSSGSNSTEPDLAALAQQLFDQINKINADTKLKSSPLVQELKSMASAFFPALSAKLVELANNSADEKERQRSVVLIGLPEPDSSKKATERAKDDREAVNLILDELNIEAEPQAVYRMGRPIDPKRKGPRLLKVVLPASTHQWQTLGGWKRERDRMKKEKQKWSRLIIRPSLSKQQLEDERKKRAEKNEQKNA